MTDDLHTGQQKVGVLYLISALFYVDYFTEFQQFQPLKHPESAHHGALSINFKMSHEGIFV